MMHFMAAVLFREPGKSVMNDLLYSFVLQINPEVAH